MIWLAIPPLITRFRKKRAKKKPWLPLSWMQGDALDTGLPDNHFDGAVMAYGLRNLSNYKAGLRELHRLLKPGGRAGILDFNQLGDGSIREKFQKFYLRKIVVPIASKAGLREHYAYLEKSLNQFPKIHSPTKHCSHTGEEFGAPNHCVVV